MTGNHKNFSGQSGQRLVDLDSALVATTTDSLGRRRSRLVTGREAVAAGGRREATERAGASKGEPRGGNEEFEESADLETTGRSEVAGAAAESAGAAQSGDDVQSDHSTQRA